MHWPCPEQLAVAQQTAPIPSPMPLTPLSTQKPRAHPSLGFRYNYLTQLWHRMNRTGAAARGEAATILMTYKNTANGHTFTENYFKDVLLQAMFCYLRFREGKYDFDVNDPVPDKDSVYGVPNHGSHTIFHAPRDDGTFDADEAE